MLRSWPEARSAAPGVHFRCGRRDGNFDGTAIRLPKKGSNGFVCIVERSWATTTDDPQFWNPKIRAPHWLQLASRKECFLPIFLMKTKLVLAGKSRPEIVRDDLFGTGNERTAGPRAWDGGPHMMSKQQYLNSTGRVGIHMLNVFYASGDAEKSWGANLPGSPIMAAYDP